jgi:hypothetical protein
VPSVAFSSRSKVRPTVVLPQPDSPTSPSVSPGKTSNESPSTARTTARLDESILKPVETSKYVLKPRTLMIGCETTIFLGSGGSSDARARPRPSGPTFAISKARTHAE